VTVLILSLALELTLELALLLLLALLLTLVLTLRLVLSDVDVGSADIHDDALALIPAAAAIAIPLTRSATGPRSTALTTTETTTSDAEAATGSTLSVTATQTATATQAATLPATKADRSTCVPDRRAIIPATTGPSSHRSQAKFAAERFSSIGRRHVRCRRSGRLDHLTACHRLSNREASTWIRVHRLHAAHQHRLSTRIATRNVKPFVPAGSRSATAQCDQDDRQHKAHSKLLAKK
jgi:hypothetical protein